MNFKKQVIIAGIGVAILLILRVVFANAQSELPIFITLLIGSTLAYIIFLYLFKIGKLKGETHWNWRRFMVYAIGIILLSVALDYTSKIHNHELSDSIWIDAHGNAWIKDVFGALLALLIFYIIFSSLYEHFKGIQKLKYQKSTAELALLKNQMNPHFFFNTLNNLYSLIKKDPEIAQEYVLKLSDVMRFTIEKGQNDMVKLKDEISYLNNYIELQTSRYHRDIRVNFEHSVKNPSYGIAPLLFINLVENAFKHGVEKMTHDAFIHITLTEDDMTVRFKIENNFDPETIEKKEGIGLINLKERLHLSYPDTHELCISNKNEIYSVYVTLFK
ncbi:histidine kinase [uncultured Dokdonia sp.]|uniref:sensor histidine kinase n=1 Tax=uncultured Dokdonia sp. TaxID=575653 RepID=UPI0026269100|nr:histidine kinase [uncultured Dokdonia sp.]